MVCFVVFGGFGGPGGGFGGSAAAVLACHYFYCSKATPRPTKATARTTTIITRTTRSEDIRNEPTVRRTWMEILLKAIEENLSQAQHTGV